MMLTHPGIHNRLKTIQQHTGLLLASLAQKLKPFLKNRRILHIGGVAFPIIHFCTEPVSRFGQRLKIQELGLDIQTGMETFDS